MSNSDSKESAREFLIEEYKAFSDSLEKNEQRGETRVNWFIGIVAAGVGGLAKIFADGKIAGWPLRLITTAGLLGLLTFGYVTLRRIIKRDARSNQLMNEIYKIRELFWTHYDASVLTEHDPFGRRKGRSDKRTFGGLADLVLSINSLLAAALVAALIMPVRTFPIAKHSICWMIAACVLGFVAFTVAFFVQWQLSKSKVMEPTHAGGVVYRRSGLEAEYLLVGPSKENPDEWLLPKGHIKNGETAEEAAIREIHEETGVTARVKFLLDTVEFKVGEQIVRAKFYLMELVSAGDSVEQRRRGWFALDAALARATHPETKALLKKAANRLSHESATNS